MEIKDSIMSINSNNIAVLKSRVLRLEIVVILMLLIILSLTATWSEASDKWTKTDYALEALWQVEHLIDWGQTRNIALDQRYKEVGPARLFIGDRPSLQSVDIYMFSSAILHPLITNILPKRSTIFGFHYNPRAVWQYISIGASGACVVNNFNIGLRCKF